MEINAMRTIYDNIWLGKYSRDEIKDYIALYHQLRAKWEFEQSYLDQ